MNYKKIYVILTIAFLTAFTACKKEFNGYLNNPNSPSPTTADAPAREPRTTTGAVERERLARIAGTARVEPAAIAQPRAEQPAIGVDEEDQERSHRLRILSQWASRLRASTAGVASFAAGRALTTTSQAGVESW